MRNFYFVFAFGFLQEEEAEYYTGKANCGVECKKEFQG